MASIVVRPLDSSRERWMVKCSYFSNVLREAASEVPGVAFDYGPKAYVGYPDAVECLLKRLDERGLKYDRGDFDPEAFLAKNAPSPVLLVAREGRRDYQNVGVDFLIWQGSTGALLADAPRLGKSCQSLTTARSLRAPTLIVCPSHVVGVWARSTEKQKCQVERWWPEAHTPPPFTPEGVKPSEKEVEALRVWMSAGGQVVVIHYDIIYAWSEILIKTFNFKTLIIDECHAFQTAGSRRSQVGVALRDHAKTRMFLSGTPMTNRPKDLFSVCNLLSPGRFGENFFKFGKRYCAGVEKQVGKGENQKVVWDFDGSSNEEELHRRLSFFMLRRTKTEVAEQLPKETREVLELEVPKRFALPSIPSLQSTAAARRALDLAADGALPQVIKILQEDFKEGVKQVAFCRRRAVAEHLFKELSEKEISTELIHGLVPAKKRDQRLQAARDSKEGHILVATIDSCSTGVDMSYASLATFVELPWEFVDLAQAKERLYNFEQFTPINIRLLCCKGTAQELQLDLLIDKLEKFEKIVGKIGDDKLKADLLGRTSGEDALTELCQSILNAGEKKPSKRRKVER